MNLDELTNFVLISGGTAKEQRVERQNEHALPVVQLAGTDLTGYYYKLSLLNRDKSLIANILYYRDEERVCPFICKLHIRTELDTHVEPMVDFDDVVKMFNGEHVEFE